MLPIRLSDEEVEELFQFVNANEGATITVDLETQKSARITKSIPLKSTLFVAIVC